MKSVFARVLPHLRLIVRYYKDWVRWKTSSTDNVLTHYTEVSARPQCGSVSPPVQSLTTSPHDRAIHAHLGAMRYLRGLGLALGSE